MMEREERLSPLTDGDTDEVKEMPEFGLPDAPMLNGGFGGVRGSLAVCGGDMLESRLLRFWPKSPIVDVVQQRRARMGGE